MKANSLFKKLTILALSVLMCISLFSVIMIKENNKSTYAASGVTGTAVAENVEGLVSLSSFTLEPTASIRLVAPVGIRFLAAIDSADLAKLPNNAVFGMLMIPNSMFDGKLTVETTNVANIRAGVWYSQQNDMNKYSCALVGAKDGNSYNPFPAEHYNTDLAVRAYVTYTDKNNVEYTVYASDSQTKSIGYTASDILFNGLDDSELINTIAGTAAKDLAFTSSSVTVGVGETLTPSYTGDQGLRIVFSSADERVFTVDENGVVTGVGAGTANLKAKVGSKEVETSITVDQSVVRQITNGNFETGDLTGWTVLEGRAFSADRISDEDTFWVKTEAASLTANRKFHYEGGYFLRGFKAGAGEDGTEALIGSIKSTDFLLGGTGYISFMLGGARHKEMYVALHDADTNEELCRIDNTAYFADPALSENLHRVFWDASAHLGKNVYIKIVDNWNSGNFGSINVDDFQTYLPEAELKNLYNNYSKAIDNLNDFAEVKDAMKNALSKQSLNLAGNAPVIVSVPENASTLPSSGVNLTALLGGVVASDDYTPAGNLTKRIISVSFDGALADTTGNFNSYDMSREGTYTINFTVQDSFGQSVAGSFKLSVRQSSMTDNFTNVTVDPNVQNAVLSVKFDEGQGKTVTDSSSFRRGSREIVNTYSMDYRSEEVAPFWTERSAVSGKALSFDGLNNSFSYPSNVVKISGNKLTVDVFVAPRNYVWSNPNDTVDKWLTHIICGQYTNDAGFKVGMTKYGYWTFQVYVDGLGWKSVYSPDSALLDIFEWNHLTCVFDGESGNMTIYKNGLPVSTLNGATGNIRSAGVDFIVGKGCIKVDNGVSEYDMSHFNGLMDELKIYNIAKTADEVLNFHKGFTDGTYMKTVVYDDVRLQDIFTDNDYYRPQYHAAPPNSWMNEPHALFQYNGKWHLFYQSNSYGPFWQGGITWGHSVSSDLVHWQHVKDAIIPMKGSVVNDGAWSGNMAFNEDGIPYLFVTAGNDARKDVDGTPLLSGQNIAVAYPADPTDPLLADWVIADSLSIDQGDLPEQSRGALNEFRDPQIFEEDGVYYMVICGRTNDSKPLIHLYTTDNGKFYTEVNGKRDYKVWTYRGNLMPQTFYDNYESKFGLSAELPNISPIYSEDGKTKKYILCFAPSPNSQGIDIGSYYWIGEFNKQTYKFTPDVSGAPTLLDTCYKAFSGGTIYFDEASKKTYVVGIIQDDRNTMERKNSGWAHSASMVREIYLRADNTLGIKSVGDYDSLVDSTKRVSLTNASVSQVNTAVSAIANEDMLRIKFKIKANGATNFGFRLKMEGNSDYVTLQYNNGTIGIVKSGYKPNVGVGAENTMDTSSNFMLENGALEGVIYIDHAMIEAFFNEKAVISSMVYNKGNSLEVFGEGITFEYFTADVLKA